MTRDEWRGRYYQRMVNAGVDKDFAAEAADIGVEVQADFDGPNVEEWDSPESAADDEMSYWGD